MRDPKSRSGLNYRTEDFVEVVRRATGGRGVDLILDIVDGNYVNRNLRALAPGGRLVQIGFQQGASATIDLWPILSRRLSVTGSTLRSRSAEEKGAIAAAVRQEVWPLLERGEIAPVIDSTFPLECAGDAHRRIESGDHAGKIVLVTSEPPRVP
ncbi:MAG: zinc-binding dehydrogenase [Acidimicrobiia bacterium]|nr:zinc-binding dehydrogenase [Acidimicrobiia bacterium]